MKLICSGCDIRTVFDLIGDKENDMTFSLGWVLANSEHFIAALLKDLTGRTWEGVERSLVKLQTGRVEYGITDVEGELGADLSIIFEAKRSAELPGFAHLAKYGAVLLGSGVNRSIAARTTPRREPPSVG
jgi:hypothetical protein